MKIDINLLKQLYLIEHPSKEEHTMITFIINWCYKKIPNLYIQIDHYNNIFITKNTTNPGLYPCLIAHMDESQTYTGTKEIMVKGDKIYGRYIEDKKQCGLGADDANGICIALQLLKELPNLKVLFTTEEEVGGAGAYEASRNLEFFCNVQYFIQADRRGKNDLITCTNGIEITSELFFEHIADICDKYDYSPGWGTFTDVGILVEELLLSGINVSCGYYNEHTWKEHTNVKELENCLNFIHEILTTLGDTVYSVTEDQLNITRYDERYCVDLERKHLTYRNIYNQSSRGQEVDCGKCTKHNNYTNCSTCDDYYSNSWNYDDLAEVCNKCKTWDCQRCEYYDNFHGYY